jgi:hypothetical protein
MRARISPISMVPKCRVTSARLVAEMRYCSFDGLRQAAAGQLRFCYQSQAIGINKMAPVDDLLPLDG